MNTNGSAIGDPINAEPYIRAMCTIDMGILFTGWDERRRNVGFRCKYNAGKRRAYTQGFPGQQRYRNLSCVVTYNKPHAGTESEY